MKSSDATLGALAVSVGRMVPGLFSTYRDFAVVLPHSVDAIAVTATATCPGATITLNGAPLPSGQASPPAALGVGNNVLDIAVTAEDGETRLEYRVKAQRGVATPDWVRVLDAAPWAPRDSAGELVFDGHMWIIGGYLPELVSDVWRSRDGAAWERVGSVPAEGGINIPVTFVHAGRMWVGGVDGRLYSSADGRRWEASADRPPWAARYGAGSAVFRGRMWVAGGAGSGGVHNDVWSSEDGAAWTLEVAEAPWSRRQVFSNLVVHDEKLWLIGGGISRYQPFRAYRDVWCSPDGRQWTKVTDQAPWPARIWSSCAVYRNRIWLLGGFRAQPTWNNFDDLWYSADGARWHHLPTEHMWEPRHEVSAYVHDDALWVVGGNAWPLKNDAWRLRLTGLAFVTQPVLEEGVRAQYSYEARADFHASAGPLTYRLAEGPPWLAVDPESGLVRGTPPEAGEFPVVIEARDAAGESARQGYTLHVLPG